MKHLIYLSIAVAATAASSAPVFEDNMAQRTLACTACHGKEGRAGPDGYYPRIAGKPAGYLYNQLLNFRDGRRHYGLMARLLDPLSDAYLLEIAQHFAALDLPYPAPRAPDAAAAVLERGRALALQGRCGGQVPACAQCHGAALTGVAPNTPGLLGLSARLPQRPTGRLAHRRSVARMRRIAWRRSRAQLRAGGLAAVTGLAGGAAAAARYASRAPRPAPPTRPCTCGSATLPAGRQQP